jgi:branched-chain amino acid transport system substrate-binding protein
LVVKDNKAAAEETTKVTEQLIKDDKVIAIVGPNASSYAIPAAAVAEREKTLLISPWSTNPATTFNEDGQPKKYVFRAAYTDTFQGRVLAKYSLNDLKLKKAAILADSAAEVLVGQATVFKDIYTANSGTVVADERFKSGDKSLTTQLQKIRSANPEIIFLPAYYKDAAEVIKQAQAMGIKTPFLGSDAWGGEELLKACGQACNGYFTSAHYAADSTNATTKQFVSDYKAAYSNSTPDDVAALSYDSVKLVAKALAMAGKTDREAVRSSMASIKDYTGVTGHITYDDKSGDPTKGAVILEIKDGKLVWRADVKP